MNPTMNRSNMKKYLSSGAVFVNEEPTSQFDMELIRGIICTHTYIHIHTCTHTYIHTYIYAHIKCMNVFSFPIEISIAE